AVLRSRVAILGFRMLHPELGMRIARAVSSTEGKVESDAAAEGRAAYIAEWARERLREEPELDFVICGHAHVPAIEEVSPGRFYLNAGDWIRHDSYITVSAEGRPVLHRWRRQAARS